MKVARTSNALRFGLVSCLTFLLAGLAEAETKLEIPVISAELPGAEFADGMPRDVRGVQIGATRDEVLPILQSLYPGERLRSSTNLFRAGEINGIRAKFEFPSQDEVGWITDEMEVRYSTPATGSRVVSVRNYRVYREGQPLAIEMEASIRGKYGTPTFEIKDDGYRAYYYIWQDGELLPPTLDEQNWTAGCGASRISEFNFEDPYRRTFTDCTGFLEVKYDLAAEGRVGSISQNLTSEKRAIDDANLADSWIKAKLGELANSQEVVAPSL